MTSKLLVPVLLLMLGASTSGAEAPIAAAAISAASDAGCLTVAGASNTVGTSRARWFFAFYPDATPLTPAGPCPEDQPHVEPPVVCAVAESTEEGTVLYLAARAGNGPTWLLRALDASSGPDAFGVAEGIETEDRCGAAEVPMAVIDDGLAAVIAAD
ncbi:MAG TPA: hypothetical protein VGB52_10360 [Actinomycetota bacterium]